MQRMKKEYIQAELKKEGDKIVFIASDETLDRHGEVIPIESWDLSKFKANPVLLVNHDYQVQNIVGKAKNVKISEVKAGKKALTFEPVFHEITQLAKEVKQMVIDGILNTVSVGFLRMGPEKDGDKERNELMEISFVPVPANPGAHVLSTLAAKEVEQAEVQKIEKFVGESDDDVIENAEVKEVKEVVEEVLKEGRVLSGKNRKMIKEVVEALNTLLEATDPNVERSTENEESVIIENNSPVPDEEKHLETPESGKAKLGSGRARGNDRTVKVLQRVAKEVNRALYQAKRN